MHSNANMKFLRKCVGQQRYPIQYYENIPSLGNPLIPDAEKHFAALLLSEFKNRYVKANLNL